MNEAETAHKLTSATSLGRWIGLGPYYAMFPVKFAFEIVETFSNQIL